MNIRSSTGDTTVAKHSAMLLRVEVLTERIVDISTAMSRTPASQSLKSWVTKPSRAKEMAPHSSGPTVNVDSLHRNYQPQLPPPG